MELQFGDTHETYKHLLSKGFNEDQAEGLVKAFVSFSNGQFVTRANLTETTHRLEKKIDSVRTELKEDIHALDKKIDSVREELKEDIYTLEKKLDNGFAELKIGYAELKLWGMRLAMLQTVTFLGLFITILLDKF